MFRISSTSMAIWENIPSEWQGLLGGPAFAGNNSMSIISQGTSGPSFYVFNPDDVGRANPIPTDPLMYFPLDHPLANDNVANDLFSRSDQYNAGILFPSGTRSVLFIGRHGYGPHTYKVDDGCGGASGEGAAPYRVQVTAFDANDLLAVKNGKKQPYDIRPYAWWTLPGEFGSCAQLAYSGLAYDDVNRKLYVAPYASSSPKVYVYSVD